MKKAFRRHFYWMEKGGGFHRRWKDKVQLPHGDAEDPEEEGKGMRT
jgi:hypothetical protein